MKRIKTNPNDGDFKAPFRTFLKRPRAGMICKVHYSDRTHRFGIVKDVVPDDGRFANREMLILKKTLQTFELSDCDYILEENRIRFE